MPTALKIDWGAARALYVANVEPKEIAESLGIDRETLYKRAKRNGWDIERDNAKSLVKANYGDKSPVSDGVRATVDIVQKSRNTYTSALSQASALTATQALDEMGRAQTLEEKALIFANLEPMSRVMKPIYGLGNEVPGQNNVQVNVLSGWSSDDVVDV